MGREVRLCSATDLALGSARRFEVGDETIVLVHCAEGFRAVADTCSHEDYSLAEGEVYPDECEIECWKHGSTFSLLTGEPLTLPATKPVKVFEVVLSEDDVKVVLGVTEVSVLSIGGLRAGVPGKEVLQGVDLEVRGGEVHVIMGPNGSGKSTLAHVLTGKPGYEVTSGSVKLDGRELLGLPVWERAQAGLFLALQYPVEVPGVPLSAMLAEGLKAMGRSSEAAAGALARVLGEEAALIGLEERFLDRPLNVDLSGGEKKRNETLQLTILRPRIAVLDEIDSGLDIDALRSVARRIEAATEGFGLGVLAITHYNRLLSELRPDVIHVMVHGRIVASGGPELSQELERTGYSKYGVDAPAVPSPSELV